MSATPTDSRAAYDALVTDMLASSPARSGAMFGMPCLKINGKAFAGFHQGTMVFKLAAPEREAALALSGARLFDPMGGRPMKEWVEVPLAHTQRWDEFARHAMRYVGGGGVS